MYDIIIYNLKRLKYLPRLNEDHNLLENMIKNLSIKKGTFMYKKMAQQNIIFFRRCFTPIFSFGAKNSCATFYKLKDKI